MACTNKVEAKHLRAALALWQYCEDSARYVFGKTLGDPIADRILEALRSKPEGLTRTEIQHMLSRKKSSTQIDLAISFLREQDLIVVKTLETGGRPAEYYVAK